MKSAQHIAFDFSGPEDPGDGEAIHKTLVSPASEPKKRGRKPKDPATIIKKFPGKRGRKSLKEIDQDAGLINIPEDEILFRKQYYSMSEVAAMFRINHSLLRFWENEFEILHPKKNKKGDRYFRPADIKNLHLIHHLLRERKYTMEGAKDYIKNNGSNADKRFEMIQSLQKIRNLLLELKSGI